VQAHAIEALGVEVVGLLGGQPCHLDLERVWAQRTGVADAGDEDLAGFGNGDEPLVQFRVLDGLVVVHDEKHRGAAEQTAHLVLLLWEVQGQQPGVVRRQCDGVEQAAHRGGARLFPVRDPHGASEP
jgi:hypothetical protein